ncbi:MAG: hypothetical protein WCB53_08855 [Terriglobales bacterium]
MPSQASATARALEFDFVSRLARFFPDATPVRIPVRLSRAHEQASGNGGEYGGSAGGNGNGNPELNPENPWHPLQETVIEFGTPQEILFVVAQPLEFADRVLVESRDGALRAEASIVAVQYHPERTVVAARFLKPVPNWIVKS